MISLLDAYGVRHSIDLEAWVSGCVVWVVEEMTPHGNGRAIRYATERTATPVYTLGGQHVEHVAGIRGLHAEEARFGESDEPITCLACVAGIT